MVVVDPLRRAEITPPKRWEPCERVLATVVSPGYTAQADEMLASVCAYADYDGRIVVFAVPPDAEARALCRKYAATLVHCRPLATVHSGVKSVLYALPQIVPAHQYLALDGDLVVLDRVEPLFSGLDLVGDKILIVRDGNARLWQNLGAMLAGSYLSTQYDLERYKAHEACDGPGGLRRVLASDLCVNDGVFAATYDALVAVGDHLSSWQAAAWTDANPRNTWRNQFCFNLAMNHLGLGVEIASGWNAQRYFTPIRFAWEGGRLAAYWARDDEIRIAHFCAGTMKRFHAKDPWRGVLGTAPIPRRGVGDAYCEFLCALRAWQARIGRDALRWTFYGTRDGKASHVDDSDTYPLFALLHYLLRARQATRVLETGTARGVSAACIASAIADQPGARLVTFDPQHHTGRDELWEALPPRMRRVIEPRKTDAAEGLARLDGAWDAALVDSLHTKRQALAEWDELKRLVRPGGIVLFHDSTLPAGTVDEALTEIRRERPVVELLGAGAMDDALGLAMVEV